jgi:hypothetical protein
MQKVVEKIKNRQIQKKKKYRRDSWSESSGARPPRLYNGQFERQQ